MEIVLGLIVVMVFMLVAAFTIGAVGTRYGVKMPSNRQWPPEVVEKIVKEVEEKPFDFKFIPILPDTEYKKLEYSGYTDENGKEIITSVRTSCEMTAAELKQYYGIDVDQSKIEVVRS